MRIIITATEDTFLDSLIKHFGFSDTVEMHFGDIFDVECDAIVSPANSFGFMDGGFDLLLSERYGWHMQQDLQRLIVEWHHGELLVGQAETIETHDTKIPYVIAAPTMRVPMKLPTGTINPYLATKATLNHIHYGTLKVGKHAGEPVSNKIQTVAFTGLGTGVGKISYETCARQMSQAIEDHPSTTHNYPQTWLAAHSKHQRIAHA